MEFINHVTLQKMNRRDLFIYLNILLALYGYMASVEWDAGKELKEIEDEIQKIKPIQNREVYVKKFMLKRGGFE